MNSTRFAFGALLAAGCLMTAFTVSAADKTWTGAVDNNWNNGANWDGGLPGTGDKAIIATPGVSVNVTASTQILTLQISAGATGVSVNIVSGMTLTLSNSGSLVYAGYEDAAINGPGVIKLSTSTGTNYADWQPMPGKTLTINAPILANAAAGLELNAGGTMVVTNGLSDFTGEVIITTGGATIAFPSIAPAGQASPLGKGTMLIASAPNAVYRFTGDATAATDRAVELRHTSLALEQAGTAPITFSGAARGTTDNGTAKTLVLAGDSAAPATYAGVIGNGTAGNILSVAKQGGGTWTLSGANTATGALTVEAGTLVLAGQSAFPKATLVNGTLAVAHVSALPAASSLTLMSGTLRIDVAGNLASGLAPITVTGFVTADLSALAADVTLPAVTITPGGQMNLVSTVPVFISGAADGQPLPGIRINGAFASYSAGSGVIPAGGASTPVPAQGPYMIGNTPDTFYTVETQGNSDGITLDAGAAAFVLAQQSQWPADVKFGAGQAFAVSAFAIAPTAATLTLGALPGEGVITAPSGTLSIDAGNPASPLTLYASVSDPAPGTPAGIAKDGAGEAVLHAPAFTGAASVNDGTLTLSVRDAETFALAGMSGAGTLAKAGAGTLLLTNASPAFTGPVAVRGGTLTVGVSDAAGASVAGRTITVSDGAALDVGAGATADSIALRQQVIIAGDGPMGEGALLNSSRTTNQNQAFQNVTLADDASVGGNTRLDLRATTTWLDLAGFTLSKISTNYLALINTQVTPDDPGAPARHGRIDLLGGTLCIEGATDLAGSADNTINTTPGSILMLYSLTPHPINWTVNAAEDSVIRAGNLAGTANNRIAGPVNLLGPGDTILNQINTSQINFEGKMSGPGGIAQASGTFYLMAPDNDYDGTTTVSNNTSLLHAAYAGSLPGWDEGRAAVKNEAFLSVSLADTTAQGWTPEQVGDLLTSGTFVGSNTTLRVDTTLRSDPVTEFPYPLAHGIQKTGSGTLALKATVSSGWHFISDEGILDVQSPGPHLVGYMRSYAGSFVLTNGASLTVGAVGQSSYLGDMGGVNSFSNRVSGNSSFIVAEKGYNTASGKFYIGQNSHAVLDIADNAYVEAPLIMGNVAAAGGAVYQTGDSVFVNTAGRGNDGAIGVGGYAHYWLDSGTFTNKGYTQVGRNKGSYGTFRQTGGTFVRSAGTVSDANKGIVVSNYDGNFCATRGGNGAILLSGGEFLYNSGTWTPNSDADYDPDPARSVITVGGDAYARVGSGSIDIGRLTNAGSTSLINFEGDGVLHARRIYTFGNASKKYINFNGGTFRVHPGDSVTFLFNYAGLTQPTRTTLYGAGATFEVADGLSRSVDIPLSAPSGRSLVGFDLDTPLTGYYAPPFPVLSSYNGTAGFIDPVYDRATQAVTGFRVHSPGFDYPADYVTVTLKGGGMADATIQAKTAPAVPGGITKTGAGRLSISNPDSTYSGPTRVLDGMLALSHPAAIPFDSHIEIGGSGAPAVLNLNGFTVTNASVTLKDGGTLANGTLAAASIRKTGSGRATLATDASVKPFVSVPRPDDALQPGMQEGMVRSSWADNALNPGCTAVQLTTAAGNGIKESNATFAGGRWAGNNHTWIYTGYVWNHEATNVTWTFRASFDDNVSLWIDNDIAATIVRTSNATDMSVDKTLAPGPHLFRVYFGDGSGNVGNNHSGVSGLEFDTGDGKGWRALADPGNGSFITVSKEPWGPFWRKLLNTPSQPGLWEGALSNSRNTVDPNPCTSIQQTTRGANGTCGANGNINGFPWPDDIMVIYSGYIWNHADHDVTWTFIENFDDTALLVIDDAVILSDAGSGSVTRGRVTLTPGPHRFEVRLGQRGGTAGLSNTRPAWWPAVTDGGKGSFLVDFQGRLDDDIANYQILENPETGLPILTTGPALPGTDVKDSVTIENGTLALGAQPGLFEGMIASGWDASSTNPKTSVQLTTRTGNIPKAHNTTSGIPAITNFWAGNNHTWVYTGYIWNRTDADQTFTFWGSFDDHVSLRIDNVEILYDNNTVGVRANATLKPGPTPIEIRFADGSGSVGPNTTDLPGGLSYTTVLNSTTAADYILLADPGDGSLLTTSLPSDYSNLSVDIAAPGVLDLCGGTNNVGLITGAGTVSNGILAAGTVLSPAGDAAVGDLTLANVTLAAGAKYRLTVNGAASDRLISSGTLDLTGLTIVPVPGMEFTEISYVIAYAEGGFTGAKPSLDSAFASKWKIIRGRQELVLTSIGGTILLLK